MFNAIPAELIETIVSNSSDSLKDLSLAGKRFVGPTQEQIFSSAVINNEEQCANLIAVLSSKPSLAPHVKVLVVAEAAPCKPWGVTSKSLPAVMLKLTGIQSLTVMNRPFGEMRWGDLSPSLKNAMQETMSRPTLTSVKLVNFSFSSQFDFARLFCKAKASLEVFSVISPPHVAQDAPRLRQEPAIDTLSQITPKVVTIQDGILSPTTCILLPAPTNPCPFVNTSNIHTLSLEAININDTLTINAILNNLPSLRDLHLAPVDLPQTSTSPFSFEAHAQLTSLSLDFSRSVNCDNNRPPVASECPITWALKALSTFPRNSLQTFKLGIPSGHIASLKDGERLPFADATLDELREYLSKSRHPALSALSTGLARQFPELRRAELFIGNPGDETKYWPVLNAETDALAVKWKARASDIADLV